MAALKLKNFLSVNKSLVVGRNFSRTSVVSGFFSKDSKAAQMEQVEVDEEAVKKNLGEMQV